MKWNRDRTKWRYNGDEAISIGLIIDYYYFIILLIVSY